MKTVEADPSRPTGRICRGAQSGSRSGSFLSLPLPVSLSPLASLSLSTLIQPNTLASGAMVRVRPTTSARATNRKVTTASDGTYKCSVCSKSFTRKEVRKIVYAGFPRNVHRLIDFDLAQHLFRHEKVHLGGKRLGPTCFFCEASCASDVSHSFTGSFSLGAHAIHDLETESNEPHQSTSHPF